MRTLGMRYAVATTIVGAVVVSVDAVVSCEVVLTCVTIVGATTRDTTKAAGATAGAITNIAAAVAGSAGDGGGTATAIVGIRRWPSRQQL